MCLHLCEKYLSGMIHELDAIHSLNQILSIQKCLNPGDDAVSAHHNEKTCANKKE